jgi:hypothetical protein
MAHFVDLETAWRYYTAEGFEMALMHCDTCLSQFNSVFAPGPQLPEKWQCPICQDVNSRIVRRIEFDS